MKRVFWAVLFTGVFTVAVAAMVKAQDTTSKPNSPPQAMVEMMKMMNHDGATGGMRPMGSMSEMMQGMDMAKMMEHCRQMMARAPGAEPNDKR
jgi:hypothetical protein